MFVGIDGASLHVYYYPTQQLDVEARQQWVEWACWICAKYQRTSSAVEGRNGTLSLVSIMLLAVWMVKPSAVLTGIHNFDLDVSCVPYPLRERSHVPWDKSKEQRYRKARGWFYSSEPDYLDNLSLTYLSGW